MDFLTIADTDPAAVERMVRLAASAKAEPAQYGDVLAGQTVGLFFMKPSTRTRVSSEVAVLQMGGNPLVLKDSEVGLGGRESVADVARVLDRYLDVLAFRVFDHADLVTLADQADAPVINLLSDLEHPCQAIADLQTLAEHVPLEGATLAYLGDGNNVCHSLMLAATMTGVSVRVASPSGYEPSPAYVERARAYGEVLITPVPADAVDGADAVYTDVWASMGQESERADRLALFRPYSVTTDLLAAAKADAIFLHCLPAHRGEEVAAQVMEHERSRVFDQAENRLHAFKGVLLGL